MIATLLLLIAPAPAPPVPDGPPPVPGVRVRVARVDVPDGPPPVPGLQFVPGVRVARPGECPSPHCLPGCDGKGCRYYSGPPSCDLCNCMAWEPEPPRKPRARPRPPVVPRAWRRTDSRGIVWTHADRAYLDRHVDAVERSYAAPPAPAVTLYYYYAAPTAATVICVGGQCFITAGR